MNEGKCSVRDIAKDLDIHPNAIHQWRRKYRADVEHAFPGKGHMRPPEKEVRRLQWENTFQDRYCPSLVMKCFRQFTLFYIEKVFSSPWTNFVNLFLLTNFSSCG